LRCFQDTVQRATGMYAENLILSTRLSVMRQVEKKQGLRPFSSPVLLPKHPSLLARGHPLLPHTTSQKSSEDARTLPDS
jgi:hypothetical protein